MKRVLITYFTQTGNTEKIAKAMNEAIKDSSNSAIKKIEDVTATDLENCDYLFIGTPCHMGDVSAQVKNFVKELPLSPGFKAALFITHAASAYQQDEYKQCIATMEALCGEKKIELIQSFNCQGFLNPQIHDMVKKMKKASDQDWKKIVAEMTGHPNKEDENNAAEFAQSVLMS